MLILFFTSSDHWQFETFKFCIAFRSVLFGEVSTLKEELQNTYMHSLKLDRVEVGSQIDLLLLQSQLCSKAIAVGHDSI